MNAIWYVLWTGCQWKALQRSWFGVCASAVHNRFQGWQQEGIFEKIMARLAEYYGKKRKVKWKWQFLDSKSCPAPLGGESTGRTPTDRAKQGSKLHLLVDKRGAPLSVVITGANRYDKRAAVDLLVAVVIERSGKPQRLCANVPYDSADVRDFVVLAGYTPHIKPNRRRGENPQPKGLGETTYPAR
jgi:putative transposase